MIIENFDIAIITAFRSHLCFVTDATLIDKEINPKTGKSEQYTKFENLERNRRLHSVLLRLGYGLCQIQSHHVENLKKHNQIKVEGKLFLVVNVNKSSDFYNKIFSLSEYYNQDSFLYRKAGLENAYLIGTNMNNDAIGYNKSVNVGNIFGENVLLETINDYERNARWGIYVTGNKILKEIAVLNK